MTKSTEYHPNELGADNKMYAAFHTGLLGVLMLIAFFAAWLLITVASLPFVLLGLMEVVSEGPTHWRTRWVRG